MKTDSINQSEPTMDDVIALINDFKSGNFSKQLNNTSDPKLKPLVESLNQTSKIFASHTSQPRYWNQILALLIVIICGASVLFQLANTDTQKKLSEQQTRYATLESLIGEIGRLDEVLTMSALMFASTGDRGWEARYNKYEKNLDNALKSLNLQFPELTTANETEIANQKLVKMERKSFSLKRDGKQNKASALINSAEYQTQKKIYSRGMKESQLKLSEMLLNHQNILNKKTTLFGFAEVVLVIFTMIGSIFLFRRSRIQNRNLQLLNATLDLRVNKQTKDLDRKARILEENNILIQTIIENLPVAVFLKDVTDNYKVKLWNKTAEELFEVPKAVILDKSAHDLWPKDQADFFLAADEKVVRDGVLLDIPEEPSQSKTRGTIYFHTKKLPLKFKGDDSFRYLLCICDDITERRKADLKLKAKTEQLEKLISEMKISQNERERMLSFLQAVLQNVPSMIFVKDFKNQLRFSMLNKAGQLLLGVTEDQIIGKNDYDIFPKDQADFFTSNDKKVFKNKVVLKIEKEDINTHKGKRLLQTYKVPTYDQNGDPELLIGISNDITEEYNLKKDLELEKEKSLRNAKLASLGEMSAGIAHEINNPLAIIEGATRQLFKFTDNPEKLHSKIETITKSCQRISRIVLGLKKFSRSGEKIDFALHSLGTISNEAIILTESKSKRHNTPVTIDCSTEALVKCDEVEIEQVFVNLINNSIDAVKNSFERWVRILIIEDETSVIVRVTDSGPGIPENVRNKLFDPFFTTKNVGEGTGLGLSITKGIIDEHNGSISVVTDCPNTCFEIRFPKAERIKNAA